MAHESFENPDIARVMNEGFVCVKVDREERPDVDAVYMVATQAMSGQGGWPMTVFATPDGRPFHCGTYYPPSPRPGMPSFPQVLKTISDAWRGQRAELEDGSARVAAQLAEFTERQFPPESRPPDAGLLETAARQLSAEFDADYGGFGGAPKFPPSMTLEQLLRHHARTGDTRSLEMVARTCDAMARGGIRDQVGGGFARYSVDPTWTVPHFEKMLYDNAQLLRVYLHLHRTTGDELARWVARETADFIIGELRTPEGGFASSLDADSEGAEGRYYVWTRDQLNEVLGPEDGIWAARLFDVTEAGNFEDRASVLTLDRDPDDWERYWRVRERLLAARRQRVRPARDDKVVTAWNGLAVGALAEAGALLDSDDLRQAAETAAELLLDVHLVDGRLRRTSLAGTAGEHPGVLEDYGCLSHALLVLYGVTGQGRWIEQAEALLEVALTRFTDERGRFHDTADDAERLLFRPADPTDSATPSGAAAVADALVGYAAYTGSGRHRAAAERALQPVRALAEHGPRFAGAGLAVAEAMVDGPREAAIVGPGGDPTTGRLHRVALAGTAPGLVVAVGEPGVVTSPLLRERAVIDGRPTAYVCRGFVCDLPTTDPAALASAVGARPLSWS